MKILIKGKKHRRSVLFQRRPMANTNPREGPSSLPHSSATSHRDQASTPFSTGEVPRIIEEIESSFYSPTTTPAAMSATTISPSPSPVPNLFTTPPPIRDLLETATSYLQDQTVQEVLPFLSGLQPGTRFNEYGVPHLDRKRHIQFLHKSLRNLPAPYVAADASRPWMFYWALTGLSTMGEDVSIYRSRVISTVRPIQNVTGGFGGGNGQMSHLAPTYAIVLSLVIVGGKEAFDVIDRKAMWKWLSMLKQPDGGFQMSVGGEEDVR